MEVRSLDGPNRELCEKAVTADNSEVAALFEELNALLAEHSERQVSCCQERCSEIDGTKLPEAMVAHMTRQQEMCVQSLTYLIANEQDDEKLKVLAAELKRLLSLDGDVLSTVDAMGTE